LQDSSCALSIKMVLGRAKQAQHTGRLPKLFDIGSLAEVRFLAHLRRIGVTTLDLDQASGRQLKLYDAG